MSVEVNPYTPPAVEPNPPSPPVVQGPIPAAQNLRLFNFIIDNIVLYAAAVGVSFAIGFVAAVVDRVDLLDALEGAPWFAIGIGLRLAYYIVFEGLTGRTLGKIVTGTVVVDAQGGKPTFGQVVLRSLCRFIPFEPFSFLGKVARGWHDSLPNTYVVSVRTRAPGPTNWST